MNENPLVTLQFNVNSKFLSLFPNDPNSDITIILPYSAINYKLRKSMLIVESKYFHEFFTNEKTEDWNIMLLSKKFDPTVYENILKCFYGGSYYIFTDSEVYSAYQICVFLKIEKFLTIIERSLIEDFERYSFFLVYQLAEVNLLECLRNRCYSYLETKEDAFKNLLDINQASLQKSKQILTQHQSPNQPQLLKLPSNLLLLLEDPFKNLIKLHNNYKNRNPQDNKRYLSYVEIYKLLKWYVEMRSQSQKETNDLLRQMVVETIDREILNSKQYHVIYHSELLLPKQEDQFFISETQCEALIGNDGKGSFAQQKQQHNLNVIFDPLLSENYLLQKELKEQKNENAILIQELKIVKETLERTLKNDAWYQLQLNKLSEQKKLEDRIQQLEKELNELKGNLKNREIESLHKYSNMSDTIESVFQLIETKQELSGKQNLVDSDASIDNSQDLELLDNGIEKERQLIFDYMPESVVEIKELKILIEMLNATIFEKLKFNLVFRGQILQINQQISSRDGFEATQLIQRCLNDNQLLFLVRTWEDEKIFGIHLKEQFIQGKWIENNQVFSINNRRKIIRKVSLRFGFSNMMIEIGEGQVQIQNNCANTVSNRCTDGTLANQKFQVDEIEVYKISKCFSMSY